MMLIFHFDDIRGEEKLPFTEVRISGSPDECRRDSAMLGSRQVDLDFSSFSITDADGQTVVRGRFHGPRKQRDFALELARCNWSGLDLRQLRYDDGEVYEDGSSDYIVLRSKGAEA